MTTSRIRSAFPLCLLVLLALAGDAPAATGELTQLPDTAGCYSRDGAAGLCTSVGDPLRAPEVITISPDGKNAYVAMAFGTADRDGISVFSRDPATGTLTRLPGTAGCVTPSGNGGQCTVGVGLSVASGITVSPDGANVYVASQFSDAVAIFSRDQTTGALTQLPDTAGCVSNTGAGPCIDGKGLDGARSVTVSPDGKNVYVSSAPDALSGAVSVFARDPITGGLTQLAGTAACVSEAGGECAVGKTLRLVNVIKVSPDGKNVYVPSYNRYAVAVFSRDPGTGALTQLAGAAGCVSENGRSKPFDATTDGECTDGKALIEARSLAISPDGANVYVVSQTPDALSVLSRDPATGALTPLAGTAGCVSRTGESDPGDFFGVPTDGACAVGKGLDLPYDVTVSPDGLSVYVTAELDDAVAVFSRDPGTGAVTQLAGTAGCVSEDGSDGDCVDGRGVDGATSVTVTPDGKHIYVTASGFFDIAVFERQQTGTPAPANSAQPTISGNAVDGETLTCNPGTWSGSPSFAFEWRRDGTPIAGVTASTYALGPDDVGKQITCRVTATNAGGSSSASSSPVTPTAKAQPPGPKIDLAPAAGPQPTPATACTDLVKPLTSLVARNVKRRAGRVTLRGSSSDTRGDCPSGVRRVQVSLALVSGRTGVNCRFLRSPRRFQLTKPQNCRRPVLFQATGTRTWSFDFKLRLKPGKYRLQARAIDAAGNKETPRQRQSIVLFTVR